ETKPWEETPRNCRCRDRHLRCDSIVGMAKYLKRACPKCDGYLRIVMPELKTKPVQAINGVCFGCGYRLAWILIKNRQSPSPLVSNQKRSLNFATTSPLPLSK